MSDPNPLKIVDVQKGIPHRTHNSQKGISSSTQDTEAKARFEREWLLHPDNFDPSTNAIERERIHRTWQHIKPLLEAPEVKAADLGFGWGILTRKMRRRGAQVDAVDIAENAIKHFKAGDPCDVICICDAMPRSSLPDDHYDVVVCTDLIAELQPRDYRLLISELYRILKPEGHLICSTPLDFRTDGALEHFAALLETEFEVTEWEISHHAYILRLLSLLKRGGRWLAPLYRFIRNNKTIALFLESLCRAASPDRGASHAICVARLKSLNTTQPVDVKAMEPQNQRLRRRIWE